LAPLILAFFTAEVQVIQYDQYSIVSNIHKSTAISHVIQFIKTEFINYSTIL